MWQNARAYVAIFWALALASLVIGASCFAYRHDADQGFAILIACVGVGGFWLIDVALRPRKGSAGLMVRRFMSYWAVVPFLCALVASLWMHYQQWDAGMNDVAALADDINHRLCSKTCDWKAISADDIERVVEAMRTARFPGDDAKMPEADNFDEVARVVGTDILRAADTGIAILNTTRICTRVDWIGIGRTSGVLDLFIRNEVVQRARRDTVPGSLLALAIQSIFVLWIPVLLATKIHTAYGRLRRRRLQDVNGASDTEFQQSVNARDVRILGEDHSFFVSRFCFGVLLVLGTNYVFAPYGLRASYIMSLVDVHALPGHTSYTLWSTSFSAAPVIVVGFVGFLVYALITATQRFVQDDLDDQAVLSLLVRGLVVILLSFALSSSPIDGTISRLFVFIAGVFPVRALEAISKRANVTIDPEFEADTTKSFDGLPSLDPAKVFALRSAGIQSSYDLAAIPIKDIASRVRIEPRLLGRAVDRALLIEAVGLDLAKKLEPFAITSATELVVLNQEGLPEPVANAFTSGDATLKDPGVRRAAVRLAEDQRVKTVKAWLDESRKDQS